MVRPGSGALGGRGNKGGAGRGGINSNPYAYDPFSRAGAAKVVEASGIVNHPAMTNNRPPTLRSVGGDRITLGGINDDDLIANGTIKGRSLADRDTPGYDGIGGGKIARNTLGMDELATAGWSGFLGRMPDNEVGFRLLETNEHGNDPDGNQNQNDNDKRAVGEAALRTRAVKYFHIPPSELGPGRLSFNPATQADLDGKSNTGHDHDNRYSANAKHDPDKNKPHYH